MNFMRSKKYLVITPLKMCRGLSPTPLYAMLTIRCILLTCSNKWIMTNRHCLENNPMNISSPEAETVTFENLAPVVIQGNDAEKRRNT